MHRLELFLKRFKLCLELGLTFFELGDRVVEMFQLPIWGFGIAKTVESRLSRFSIWMVFVAG